MAAVLASCNSHTNPKSRLKCQKPHKARARWPIFVHGCPSLSAMTFDSSRANRTLLGLDVLAQAPLARHRLLGKDAAAPFAPQTGRCRAHPVVLAGARDAWREHGFL